MFDGLSQPYRRYIYAALKLLHQPSLVKAAKRIAAAAAAACDSMQQRASTQSVWCLKISLSEYIDRLLDYSRSDLRSVEYPSSLRCFVVFLPVVAWPIIKSIQKSKWMARVLREREELFLDPPQKCLFCYSVYQPLYDEMSQDLGSFITFFSGIPKQEDISNFTDGSQPTMLVLDDMLSSAYDSSILADLFTKIAHHSIAQLQRSVASIILSDTRSYIYFHILTLKLR